MDAVDCLSANIRNQPIEDIEMHLPFRFHRYELIEREFGHGKWRGGTSAVRDYAFLTPAQVTTESERHADIDPPPGVFGGTPGRPGRFWHVRNDGTQERLYSKVNALPLRRRASGWSSRASRAAATATRWTATRPSCSTTASTS